MDIFMPHTARREHFKVTDKPINSKHTESVRVEEM